MHAHDAVHHAGHPLRGGQAQDWFKGLRGTLDLSQADPGVAEVGACSGLDLVGPGGDPLRGGGDQPVMEAMTGWSWPSACGLATVGAWMDLQKKPAL